MTEEQDNVEEQEIVEEQESVTEQESVEGEVLDGSTSEVSGEKKNEPLALAGMIVGICGATFTTVFICCYGWIPAFICGLVAVVLSVIALNKIKADPSLGGKGMAIAGIATGAAAIIIPVLLIILAVLGLALGSVSQSGGGY